jgi:hypothetical protein
MKGGGANAVEMPVGALAGTVVRDLVPSHKRRRVLTRLERGLGGVQLLGSPHEHEHVPGFQAEVRVGAGGVGLPARVTPTVMQSARRIVVAIAGQWPQRPAYIRVARRCGALPAGP